MRTIAPDSRRTTETEPSLTSTQTNPSHVTLWNSPVPYLFGGLAAMLGLIIFALLILACSYWKVSRQLLDRDNERESRERMDEDLERGKEKVGSEESAKAYGEQILIIMAGDEIPSFLATPVGAKISSSFGGNSSTDCSEADHEDEEKEKMESHCDQNI